MSFSLISHLDSEEQNDCYLVINGDQLGETSHYTYSETGLARSTGGRVVTVEASAGDKIEIRTALMHGRFWRILYCSEFIPKM